jgi:hypothetical protein
MGPVAAQQPAGNNDAWANKLFGGVTTKDFGTVAKGAQLKYSFKMTNIYTVPLEITFVRPNCSCVTVNNGLLVQNWPESSRVIAPKESIYLNINMDSRRFNGPKAVQIFVTVGPQYISTATLTVQANTRQDVVLNPGEIDFGVVHHGNTPTQIIDIEHAGNNNWRLEEIVKNSNAPFDLRVEDLKGRIAGKSGYRIFATLKAEANPGQFKEEILLKTNDPGSQVLTFNIIGNIQAPLSASPSTVSLNSAPGAVQEPTRVSIRGSQPFRILRIDGQGQGISAMFAGDRLATMHVITIRCDQPGEQRRTLTVVSSLNNEAVQITVETHNGQ